VKLRTMAAWLGQYLRRAPIEEVSAAEVRQGLGTGAFTLLDANLRGQWVRGHIPGAKYAGMEEDLERILPADRKAPLVFYCESSL
jgi:rhodanese-related sulfurtransferase